MIKDVLTDIVAHTHGLGFLPLIKITGSDDSTIIEGMAEDRSVILNAKIHNPVDIFDGVFGMSNLDKLNLLLKSPEYKENATIDVIVSKRKGEDVPTGLHFENEDKDFINDYRFISTEIINETLKSVKFKGTTWDIEFVPSINSAHRLKLQAQVHSDQSKFKVRVENKDLIFSFGDGSTHTDGEFVFQAQVQGKMKQEWFWPIQQVLSILNLNGDMTMKLTDQGAMMITLDSGLAEYNYILPAQTK